MPEETLASGLRASSKTRMRLRETHRRPQRPACWRDIATSPCDQEEMTGPQAESLCGSVLRRSGCHHREQGSQGRVRGDLGLGCQTARQPVPAPLREVQCEQGPTVAAVLLGMAGSRLVSRGLFRSGQYAAIQRRETLQANVRSLRASLAHTPLSYRLDCAQLVGCELEGWQSK